jgi:phosphomannomutase / phosphoglucomutase
MEVNPSIFRAYDIRGIYPSDLSDEAVQLIARAYVNLYPRAQKIVLARDPRVSSPILAEKISQVLIEAGREVIDLGIAPDPLFYFSIFHYHFDGGFMISGSHNPKEYNGLTIHIRKPGKKISEDVIGDDLEKIKAMVLGGVEPARAPGGKRINDFNPAEDYISYVSQKFSLKRPLKIIIDSGNGAMGPLPEKVFRKLGCRVKTLFAEYDGNFPNHLPNPYEEENIKEIKKEVLREKADLGLAYDSDGDRVALIDPRGKEVGGDFCLLMLARQALQKKKGPIVHDMRVSKAFLDDVERMGATETHFSISHHNAVINKIIETKAVFGGELTLHFLFPLDYYLYDDALFASLKLAEVVSGQANFVKYIDGLPRYYPSPEVFIDVPDEEKFGIIDNLQKYLRENDYDFIDIDGARINFSHGWALARAANTTPHIKCRFEGDTKEHLVEIEKNSLAIFQKVGIPITPKIYHDLGL